MAAFPLHALLTGITGKMCGDFGEFHKLAEHVMGHPIWTHEFASADLADLIAGHLSEMFPEIRAAGEAEMPAFTAALNTAGDKASAWAAAAVYEAAVARRVGATSIDVPAGRPTPRPSPLDTIPEALRGKTIAVALKPR